ncbi:MAG TPA: filamentous hemagglutinin N-terminal domain-containing protein, partial [Rhodocyclaceae bacterium]|nr:filamentous hemagglutinin N-terminal domain-containing protein [Rhodocyclaceae bacterium]
MKRRILIACIQAALGPSLVAGGLFAPAVVANPVGGVVVSGTASFTQQNPNTLLVRNGSGAVINWKSFSIGASETTIFDQASAASWVLNRVTGGDISRIYGHLKSNGRVFLVNRNGIFVGPGAVVDTTGFVGSTLGILDSDLAAGRLQFAKDGKAGSIVNQGVIRTQSGGNVVLMAPRITNQGTIDAPGGEIILAAGQKATITSLDLDGVAFQVQAPADTVLNLGKLLADDGAVKVFAGTLKHSGEIRANAITRDSGGQIVLASRAGLDVTAVGSVTADGPSGGSIRLESATGTARVAGRLRAVGSADGGGQVDVLGRQVSLTGKAAVDASGATGGGNLRIGGDFQGNNPDVPNATDTFVAAGVRLAADATGLGKGGRIVVWSDGNTRYLGKLSARGGPLGGDGGFAEVSGKGNLLFLGGANLGAPKGTVGDLLLDPLDLFVDALGGLNPYVINEASDFPAHAITVTPATLAAITGNVTLYASRDLRINSAIALAGAGQGLSAHAGRDLQLGAAITTTGGAVSLDATRDISTFAATAINTGGGAVTLHAGRALSGSSLNVNAGGGAVSESSAAGTLASGTVSGSGSLTLAAVGGNLSTSNLTSSGAVTLSSSAASVSTGTVASGGALAITGATSVGTSNLNSNGAAVTIHANGGSLSTGTITSQAGAGPAGGAINLTGTSSVSVSGAVAGNGNVAISGTSVNTGALTTT